MNKVVLKEFQQTNFQSFSDGQITIQFPNEEDLTEVEAILTPTGGFYEGGRFVFGIKLPTNYPHQVAAITCKTKIFHPNINYEGYICFNILADEWTEDVRLVDYAHSLLWLLYQPNLDSRLNGDCPNGTSEFARLVRRSLHGGEVAGQRFPKMIDAPEPAFVPTAPRPNPNVIHAPVMAVRDLVRMFTSDEETAQPPAPRTFTRRTATTAPTTTTPTPTTTPHLVTTTTVPPTTTTPPAVATPTEPTTTAVPPEETRRIAFVAAPIVNGHLVRFVPIEPPTPVVVREMRTAPPRRWPAVSGGVRFVNGARAY